MPRPYIAVAKKKKRRSSGGERSTKRLRAEGNRAFLSSLENQGMLRVAATPDEVNNDLALILHGMDSARANGSSRPPVERPTDSCVRGVDKIHSSRGILHYHDITYEKGDRVAMFGQGRPNGGPRHHRYSGVILTVNSKELHIKADDGKLFASIIPLCRVVSLNDLLTSPFSCSFFSTAMDLLLFLARGQAFHIAST